MYIIKCTLNLYSRGVAMEVKVKELRERPGYYLKLVESGAEVIITSNGVKKARLVPMVEQEDSARGKHFHNQAEKRGFLFGIWSDRNELDDVSGYVHDMRAGRSL